MGEPQPVSGFQIAKNDEKKIRTEDRSGISSGAPNKLRNPKVYF